jgi:hypothetical protein
MVRRIFFIILLYSCYELATLVIVLNFLSFDLVVGSVKLVMRFYSFILI